jgi:dTDP-4-amino-4,6-dideoxygalactose transaminase
VTADLGRGAGVPAKDYARQYGALMDELLPELRRVLLSEDPILGASLAAFEREFAACIGTREAIGLNSGTDALVLGLKALGVGPGDEVVTTGHTFLATIGAIVTAGARPVLVDPDPVTMNADAARLEAALTTRTKAVLPVHIYGLLCPMAAIRELCEGRRLLLVEDAAQAHGARDADGKAAGSFGSAGCFSFHPSKNLGAFGDGGCVTTDDGRLAERLRVLRNLGKVSKHEIHAIGANSKLDTLQAAILRIKLRRLEGDNARRRALAGIYRERLSCVPGLVLPHDPKDASHVFHQYVVRSGRRDALREHLSRDKIHAGMHYPIPPHLQRLDVDLGYRKGQLPVTEAIAATCLSLPISPELGDDQIERCCESIRRFLR